MVETNVSDEEFDRAMSLCQHPVGKGISSNSDSFRLTTLVAAGTFQEAWLFPLDVIGIGFSCLIYAPF